MTSTQPGWQASLKNAVTQVDELLDLLELDPKDLGISLEACRQFPVRVTREFISRMKKGWPEDPLLLQVLPLGQENQAVPGYSQDPLKEQSSNPVPGLLHKYPGRVLLMITSACAIHCRYCFRRYFPYQERGLSSKGWQPVLDYIQNDPSIQEVILSGGDPLVAKDAYLSTLTHQLSSISHVKRLRIHTRLPIVLPLRITSEFIDWLSQIPLETILVLHCNHPQEVDQSVVKALKQLRQLPITLLNQAVLLKKINDNAQILIELNEMLFSQGVMPYYLHVLDKVAGCAHFSVTDERAKIIIQTLLASLPGYLVPKLVREVPGMLFKCPINI